MISNYSYDPRLHLQPLNGLLGISSNNNYVQVLEDQQYSSSNMDDLIDSNGSTSFSISSTRCI